jgi:carboxymethylenebutenolidase
MAVVTDWAVIETADGQMPMYMARPEGGSAGPGILVVHDIFGLTEHVQEVCRRFAGEGLIALAPDLYYSFATRKVPYEEPAQAKSLRQQRSDDKVFDDLYAAFRLLAARGEVRSGLVGAVGFGTGGRDAFLQAARNPEILALVTFYAPLASETPTAALEASARLEPPALLIFAGEDTTISANDVADVDKTLAELGKDYELITYPRVGHGFFCDAQLDVYDAETASEAWNRTVDFLYERLEG